MKALLNKDDVVIAVSEEIEKVRNGFLVKDKNMVYASNGLRLVDTKLTPKPGKDKIVNGVVMKNPDFKTIKERNETRKNIELKRLLDTKVITKEEYDKIAK